LRKGLEPTYRWIGKQVLNARKLAKAARKPVRARSGSTATARA
jgi:hypothetical protein